jgi:hypothetical protein
MSTPGFGVLFPNMWTDLPDKLKRPYEELRFMGIPHCFEQQTYAIPSIRTDGKTMVAAGYGGTFNEVDAKQQFIELYHPDLRDKPLEQAFGTIQSESRTPVFDHLYTQFRAVQNVLAIAPCQKLESLFGGCAFSINGSLSNGHCGSFLFDSANPRLFYGIYTGVIFKGGKLHNVVWSLGDPSFVFFWISHALPFFTHDSFVDVDILVHVVEYLKDVHAIIDKLGLGKIVSDVEEKLAKLQAK